MTLICGKCGSTNIQVRAWVDANTHEFAGEIDEFSDSCWCEDCQDETFMLEKEI